MGPFIVKGLPPQIQGTLSAFSDCFQLAADVLVHPAHARHCPEDDQAGPAPNRFLAPPTRPTSGSSPAALADWQRASRYRCGSLRASRGAQISAQNFCAPFRSGHLPPHAPQGDNGYSSRTVKGSQRLSPFLHQPLKSTVHTSLRAAASRPLLKRPASGARRRRRFCVRPVLSKTLLTVLSLATSPCRRKYNSRILRGPQAACAQLQTHDFTHLLFWQLLRMAFRPPRLFC